jgi:CheY-like chemotaxis protein
MTVSRKVLFVGDDKVTQVTFEKLAAGKNYAVDTVASGEDALWRFDDDEYDAVFTDLNLRGISGFEVAEGVHARQADVPVAILSATDSKLDRERAQAAQATEFWLKSQTDEQLAAAIDRVLQSAEIAAAARPRKPKKSQTTTILLDRVRSMLLFIFAPFIALGYIITFPLVGLGALVWFAVRAVRRTPAEPQAAQIRAAKDTAARPAQGILKTGGMLIAVIVIGVCYGVIGPIFGFLLVIYYAFEAWGRLGAKAIKAGET